MKAWLYNLITILTVGLVDDIYIGFTDYGSYQKEEQTTW
jgi:hypothetical protein